MEFGERLTITEFKQFLIEKEIEFNPYSQAEVNQKKQK
ncbi:hypothetical protein SAMN04488559_101105 [Isobaculum melis]|uniref:Uncharacterized protein n=1 Tax=Isobaculum melis TaxID=142588 RepID=A0A1H9PS69_9LACT|nr:hypothetical protein SAMN04488559_101105 [Isobaculum melis]